MPDNKNQSYTNQSGYKEAQDYDQFVDLYRMLQNVFVSSTTTANQYKTTSTNTPPTPPKQEKPKKKKETIYSASKVRLIEEQAAERMRSGKTMMAIGACTLFLGWLFVLAIILCVYGYYVYKQGKNTDIILNRFFQYLRVLKRKNPARISELALEANVGTDYVMSDLQQMIEKGMFIQGHIDRANGLMYVTDEAFDIGVDIEQFSEVEPEEITVKKEAVEDIFDEDAAPESVRNSVIKAEKHIQKMQRRKKQIQSSFVQEQLTEMETTLRQIIEYVIAHPATANDIDKLMKYYLPTSIKLLDTYRDLETQTVQGGNIAKSKKDIEEVLVTLNQGYKILLDDMFKDTSMDVSSDISVLESLLAQEGLTGQGIKEKEKVE